MVNPITINQELSGKKILMIAPCLGKFGGIEAFCLTLCEDIINRGASISLLRKKVNGFFSDGSIEQNEDEITSAWSNDLKKNFSSQYVTPRDSKILDAIKDCDLVHLHNPIVEGVWWAKKEKKPCVMTVYNWRRRGIHPRLLAWKWAVKNADRTWYISEFVWRTWEKYKCDKSDRLPVVSKMPKGQYDTGRRKGFLFIGRFVPNKGIRILLDAYHIISPDPELWPLTLVGNGPLRAEVENIILTKKILGVHLTGFVSEADRHDYTREAKWMVTPPNTKEDLGLTPLEARSVGVPCIASTDGGVRETAGDHALFCKPGCVKSLANCLRQAINMSEEQYKKKSKEALIGLEDYVRPLDQYSDHYLKLINRC